MGPAKPWAVLIGLGAARVEKGSNEIEYNK
jgi:hypothetical protein